MSEMIVLPVNNVYPGRAREASVYVETLMSESPYGSIVNAHLFAYEDGTGTVGVLLPEVYAEHRVKGGALSVKIFLPAGHAQDTTDDLWRLIHGAPTTPVKGMEGVLNSVVLPGCFAPPVEPVVVVEIPVKLSSVTDPVNEPPIEPVTKPAVKSRRGRVTTVA